MEACRTEMARGSAHSDDQEHAGTSFLECRGLAEQSLLSFSLATTEHLRPIASDVMTKYPSLPEPSATLSRRGRPAPGFMLFTAGACGPESRNACKTFVQATRGEDRPRLAYLGCQDILEWRNQARAPVSMARGCQLATSRFIAEASLAVEIRWFPPSWLEIRAGGFLLQIDPAYTRTDFLVYPKHVESSKWPDLIDGLPEPLPKADLILLTHHHKDHTNPTTITRSARRGTRVLGPPPCQKELGEKLSLIQPGERARCGRVQVKAVHS